LFGDGQTNRLAPQKGQLGLESVLLPAGIMLLYGVAFFALAVWRFRFE